MNMKANKKVLAIVAVVALVAILGVCLVACNADNYEKRLEDKDYVVLTFKGDDIPDEYKDDAAIEFVVKGTKGLGGLIGGESVTVIKFKKSGDAKDYAEEMEKVAEKVKRSGKIVIYGTEQGVKDAQ